MSRLAVIIAILILIFIALRYFKAVIDRRNSINSAQQKNSKIESVRPCAFCGTHSPQQDMIEQDNHFFCSYAHLQQYLDKHG